MLPPVKYVRSVSPCPSVCHRNESGPLELTPGCCEPGSPLSQAIISSMTSEPRFPLTRAVIGPTRTHSPLPDGDGNASAGTASPEASVPLWIATCQLVCDGWCTTWISPLVTMHWPFASVPRNTLNPNVTLPVIVLTPSAPSSKPGFGG